VLAPLATPRAMAAVLALVRAPLQPGAAPLFGVAAVAAGATPYVSKQSREAAATAPAAVALTPSTTKISGSAAAGAETGNGRRAHPPAVWALDNTLALVTGWKADARCWDGRDRHNARHVIQRFFKTLFWSSMVSVRSNICQAVRDGVLGAGGVSVSEARARLHAFATESIRYLTPTSPDIHIHIHIVSTLADCPILYPQHRTTRSARIHRASGLRHKARAACKSRLIGHTRQNTCTLCNPITHHSPPNLTHASRGGVNDGSEALAGAARVLIGAAAAHT
jgi:hypothetical protein